MLKKIKGPDKVGREAMYYAERQDFAYQHGAYDYLHSIAMLPRMATIAAYLRAFGVHHVLDVGCGTGDLLAYLDANLTYLGVDISPTAIHVAQERHATRPHASFSAVNFRQWACPRQGVDGVVWAGIGSAWTRQGRGGNTRDWLDILMAIDQTLVPGGHVVFELVTSHWPTLEALLAGRYEYETGCDIHCFHSEESPRRAIRVFRRP